MVSNCAKFVLVKEGDGFCGDIAKRAGITTSDFYKYNAGVGDGCQNLWLDTYYCVGLIGMTTTTAAPTTTTTRGPTTTTTTPGNGVATPQPTQPGMVSNCARFVLVREGDGFCGDIAKRAGISTADFYAWNSGVGTGCQNLWLDTYYCVGLIGATTPPTMTTPPATTSTTTTGNGVATPTPIQDGMVSNCRKFHFGEFLP
jgi:hypothetical protein